MKLAKGFRGRYFSLAAIAATVSCINLQAVENSVQSHEQRIAQTTEREIDDDVEELEDIVVESALPSSSKLKNLTSDVTVITSEELEEKHYNSVVEALKSQADIQITQYGGPGQASSFTMRGMHAKYVLVMIDGIRVNDPSNPSGYAQLEHLSLGDVDRIEIVKGSQSGVWGADAAAGVINIVTKQSRKGLHLSGGLMAGSHTTHRGDIALSYATDRFDVKAGFDGLKTDGYPPKTDSNFDAADIERTYFAKAGINFSSDTRLEGSYRKIVSDTEYEATRYAPPTYAPQPYKAAAESDLDFYRAKLTHRWRDFDFALYGNGSEFERTYHEDQENLYKGKEYEGGLKGRYDYGEGTLDLGYTHRESKMDQIAGNSVDEKVKNNAVYGAIVHRMLNDRFIANVTFRYDDYDKYEDKTTGKVGLKYLLPFAKDAFVAANAGNGYRVPSLFERFGGAWNTEANPDLDPEKTASYDVSAGAWGFSVTYFYNEIDDLIQWQSGATWMDPSRYENVPGKSKIQGVDISYRRAFETIPSSLSVAYTYTDAKDADDQRLLNTPRHRATAGYTLYPSDRLSLGLDVEYAKDYLSYGYPQNRQMGEYIVWNAVVNYGFEEYGGVYLKVVNLFDEEYQLVDGYNTEEQSVYAGWRFSY